LADAVACFGAFNFAAIVLLRRALFREAASGGDFAICHLLPNLLSTSHPLDTGNAGSPTRSICRAAGDTPP
jgi:hypothetical protein